MLTIGRYSQMTYTFRFLALYRFRFTTVLRRTKFLEKKTIKRLNSSIYNKNYSPPVTYILVDGAEIFAFAIHVWKQQISFSPYKKEDILITNLTLLYKSSIVCDRNFISMNQLTKPWYFMQIHIALPIPQLERLLFSLMVSMLLYRSISIIFQIGNRGR